MKMRATGLVLLVLCVLGGLIAAIFTPTLAATLTPPATSGAGKVTGSQFTAPVAQSATATRSVPSSTAQPTTPVGGVTVLAQDTFQRPDQPFWGTSSGLRIWGGDANTRQAFAIVKHAGQITGGQGALQATLNVASADAEILLSGTVSQFDENGTTNLGVILRWQDANNWYKVLIDGTILQLLKEINGKISVLAEQPFKATSGTSYSLRFRVLGSALFARAWASTQPEPATWTIMKIDTQLATGMSGVRVKIVPGVVIRVTSFLETSVPNTM